MFRADLVLSEVVAPLVAQGLLELDGLRDVDLLLSACVRAKAEATPDPSDPTSGRLNTDDIVTILPDLRQDRRLRLRLLKSRW